MSYKVIAECVDQRSGKRFEAGETFSPDPDQDQAERLIRAGCIRHVSDEPARTPVQAPAVAAAAPTAEIPPAPAAAPANPSPRNDLPVRPAPPKAAATTTRKGKRG